MTVLKVKIFLNIGGQPHLCTCPFHDFWVTIRERWAWFARIIGFFAYLSHWNTWISILYLFKFHNQLIQTKLELTENCRVTAISKNCDFQSFKPLLNRNINVKVARNYILSQLWPILHNRNQFNNFIMLSNGTIDLRKWQQCSRI